MPDLPRWGFWPAAGQERHNNRHAFAGRLKGDSLQPVWPVPMDTKKPG